MRQETILTADQILTHLEDPVQLEKLYRTNKLPFKREFNMLYPQVKGTPLADFWNERLNYEAGEINWGTGKDFMFLFIASIIAGVIAKLPAFLPISEDFFYPRNIGFIIFPALMVYFARKNKISGKKIAFIIGSGLAGLIFINSLPNITESDTIILACIHLPLFLWAILGIAFVGERRNTIKARLAFLKYNGDLVVICALIGIAGVILTGITIGLFSMIGLQIEDFYFEYIVIFCLPAVPIVGTYLTQTNPLLVGKVSPVIAKIFSPLVLVMLVIYLGAMVYSGKDPFMDREFLMMFNALLIGVMAIIFFSVAETSGISKTRGESWILLLLSIVTIVVNGIALSAILFRITEWGITPNRLAVLGANVLVLINLLLVSAQLFKTSSKKENMDGVGRVIATYLPVYFIWAVIVIFLFPFIFGFE